MNLKDLMEHTKHLNILYVEDEEDIRERISDILGILFLKVDSFEDGAQALEAYTKYHSSNKKYYDLILTDLAMPKMGGLQLCNKILEKNKDQYIIVITAYNERDKLQELMLLGIDGFIHKPLHLEDLFEILEKYSKLINTKNKL